MLWSVEVELGGWGRAVVELLEALSWAVVEKWVRLRVVMVIGSMHEGVKACLGWSLRWWWSRLSGSLVLWRLSMVMVKGGEGYWFGWWLVCFWWRLPGIKGCLLLLLFFVFSLSERWKRLIEIWENFPISLFFFVGGFWSVGKRVVA